MAERILHVSDTLAGVGRDGDVEEGLGGFGAAVQRALDLDVDALVHTGNMFRRPEPAENLLAAVEEKLDGLAAADVTFLFIAGRRESYVDAEVLDRLQAHEATTRLGTEPTMVGETALYGIDYVDDISDFEEQLTALEPSESFTYNVVCVNQRIWPPARQESADISSYDLLDATDVHVDEVLAGGLKQPRIWESDDFDYRVTYAGSTNPQQFEAGRSPRGTLLRADPDDRGHDRVRLVTTAVDEEIAHLRRALDFEPSDLEDVDTETLADLYGLAARAKSLFDDRRKEVRDELLERVEDERRIDGRYASVDRSTRRSRSVKSEDVVYDAVERAGIERDSVTTVDTSALRDLVDEGTVDEEQIFEVDERPYVRVGDVSLDTE